jgi:hypothetical protein
MMRLTVECPQCGVENSMALRPRVALIGVMLCKCGTIIQWTLRLDGAWLRDPEREQEQGENND